MKKNNNRIMLRILSLIILEVFLLSFVFNCKSINDVIAEYKVNNSKINKLNNVKQDYNIIPHHLNHNVVFNFKDKDQLVLNNLGNGIQKVKKEIVKKKKILFDDSVMKNAVKIEASSHNVSPNENIIMKYKGVILEIPAGAVKEDTEIIIKELSEVEKLNAGMNNVTGGVSGYRFLPDGMKFEKMVRVTIPFNKEEIRNDDDLWSLYTYFYNEETKKWIKLQRVDINEEEGTISSLTNHFTDLINSTLKLPESPKPMNFNPTSIKDIKAANPLTGISQIQGFEANTSGAASFSLPLNIPSGRQGMAPGLAVSYNSENPNGWLGVGFNIDIPAITIDTRFGLPEYNYKTDTLLLNGQEMLFVGEVADEAEFKTRVESFNKIIRTSDNYFIVTSKDGTKYLYGKDEAKLACNHGTYIWYIKNIIDTNGNKITYNYKTETYEWGEKYTYLENIIYTGHVSTGDEGSYRIEFDNDPEERNDKILNCRGRFKSLLKERLKEIKVIYINNLVRSYEFEYSYNHFGKSNIVKIIEKDKDGNEFYSYDFDYFDMPKEDDEYQGFSNTIKFGSGLGYIPFERNHSFGGGADFYLGFGFLNFNISFGLNIGFNIDYSYNDSSFLDMNGDGLPDMIQQTSFQAPLECRFNNFETGSFGTGTFEGISSSINDELQIDFNIGGSFDVSLVAVSLGVSLGATLMWSKGFSTFTDFNGDGYVDYIPPGSKNSYMMGDGEKFTNYTFDSSIENTTIDLSPSTNSDISRIEKRFHLVDPVRKWISYHNGVVKIEGEAVLEDTENESDGVKLNVYHNNDSLWTNNENTGSWNDIIEDENERKESILLKNDAGYTNNYTHTEDDRIPVEKGDRLYFKASSIDEVVNDKIRWDLKLIYEEIEVHDNMKDYFCGYIIESFTPADYLTILDAVPGEYKVFFESCYRTVEDEFDNVIGYEIKSLLPDTLNKLKTVYQEMGYIVPLKIEKDIFETNILPFTDDSGLVEISDRDFIKSAYKPDIFDLYYVLEDDVTDSQRDKIFNILSNEDINYINSIKYYKYEYNDDFYTVWKEDNKYYINLTYDKNITEPVIDFPGNIENIGDISSKGVLIEKKICDDGQVIKKWINENTDDYSLIIDYGITDEIKTENVEIVPDDNYITVKDSYNLYIKNYIIEKSGSLPIKINSDIFENIYFDLLDIPVIKNDFDTLIIPNLAPAETGFVTGCYDPVTDSEGEVIEYQLKDISNTDKLSLLEIYFNINYFKRCYLKNAGYYEIISGLSSGFILEQKNILNDAGFYVYSDINKNIKVLSSGSYITAGSTYVGEKEEAVISGDMEKDQVITETSYILCEDFDENGNTIENKKYIHIFDAESDFNLDNFVKSHTDIPEKFTVSEFERNISFLSDDEDETSEVPADYSADVKGASGKNKSFFESMYLLQGDEYILQEDKLEEYYVEGSGSDKITNKDRLELLFTRLGYSDEYFSGGYYNWFYGEWNGNEKWDENKIGLFDENEKISYFSALAPIEAEFTKEANEDDIYYLYENELKMDIYRGSEFSYRERQRDENGDKVVVEKYFASYISSEYFNPSRLGGDSKNRLPVKQTKVKLNEFHPDRMIRKSYGFSINFNASLTPNSLFGNVSNNYGERDLFDINGDRYPDLLVSDVGQGTIDALINKEGKGFGKYKKYTKGFEYFRHIFSYSIGLGVSISSQNIGSWLSLKNDAQGKVKSGSPSKADYSFGGGIKGSFGSSQVWVDWADINGDGLVDQIRRTGSGSADFEVMLNTGDDLESYEVWKSTAWDNSLYINPLAGGMANPNVIKHDTISSGSFSVSAGYKVVNGNASFGLTSTCTKVDLIDMNGDGLPDQVLKMSGKPFAIKFNLGSCFGPEVKWDTPLWDSAINLGNVMKDYMDDTIDALISENGGSGYKTSGMDGASFGDYTDDMNIFGIPDVINYTGGLTVGIGLGFTVVANIPPILELHISANGKFAYGMTGAKLQMRDIDGDGLPDHIMKLDSQDYMMVKLNNAKKVGLLQNINTPSGGNITLDYTKTPNTDAMPGSRFVLSSVVRDGTFETNGADEKVYYTVYEYSDGYYERYKREFYGFGKITVYNADGSMSIGYYNNSDFYKRGTLELSEVYDTDGNIYTISQNTYGEDIILDTGEMEKDVKFIYPIESVTTIIDTETGEELKTGMRYLSYDGYGNVLRAVDLGNYVDLNDDLYIEISYDNDNYDKYIMNNPESLEVKDSNGDVLRKRGADYYSTGNLRSLTQYVQDEVNNISDSYTYIFTYDPYGNMKTTTDPKGYGVEYFYDDRVYTYVVQTTDSGAGYLGYSSFADYDYALGVNTSTTDLNGNIIGKKHDSFGRVISVWTGYDSYNPVSDTGTPAVRFEYYHKEYPARAVTKNKVHFDSANSETLDTVIIIDGMGRVMQTKKEGEFANEGCTDTEYGMNVSGKVIYDSVGRVIEAGTPVKQIDNAISKLTHDPDGLYGFYDDVELNNPTVTEYDSQGRAVKTILPDDSEILSEYIIEDGIFKTIVTDPKGKKKISYTDIKENILKIEQFNKYSTNTTETITTSYKYDLLGQITDVIDTEGNTTKITYDSLGRRTSIDNPDSGYIVYKYDETSNMTEKTDPNLRSKSQKIKYNYDIAGRLLKVDYPVMDDVTYIYGDPGESDNRAGRLLSVTDDAGITSFYYGLLGEQTRIVKDFRCVTSDAGADRIFTLEYTYDYLGRIENMTYPSTGHNRPGETVSYEYDLGGQVKRVIGNYSDVIEDIIYVDNIMYDEFGQRVFLRYGNGVETRYTYNQERRWLDNIQTTSTKTGKTIQNMDYTFDEVGNILSITNDVRDKVTHTYTYDDLYQLVSAKGNYEDGVFSSTDDYEQNYVYDKIGNMTKKVSKQWNESGRGKNDLNYDFTYTYDNDHPHRAVKIGDINYDYDPNGNLTKKWKENNIVPNNNTNEDDEPNPNDPLADYENKADEAYGYDWSNDQPTETILTEYIWDEENRLTKAVTGGDTVHFIYNAGGERVIKRVENKKEILYVDSVYQLQVGVDEDVITKHMFVGTTRVVSKVSYEDLANNAETERRNTFFYHPDHLGSSNYLTDRDGEVYQEIQYTPYGETWFEDGQDKVNEFISHKFTSKELDLETGLYYFGFRYYDPQVSRWASADPIYDGVKDGYGVYTYCRNNPLKYLDPNGLQTRYNPGESGVDMKYTTNAPQTQQNNSYVTNTNKRNERERMESTKRNYDSSLGYGTRTSGIIEESNNSNHKLNKLEDVRNIAYDSIEDFSKFGKITLQLKKKILELNTFSCNVTLNTYKGTTSGSGKISAIITNGSFDKYKLELPLVRRSIDGGVTTKGESYLSLKYLLFEDTPSYATIGICDNGFYFGSKTNFVKTNTFVKYKCVYKMKPEALAPVIAAAAVTIGVFIFMESGDSSLIVEGLNYAK